MQNFFSLTPDKILNYVEDALKKRATGRCLALNSLENRVYEIELDDDEPSVVAKFYRPQRWTAEAISDEHRFIADLDQAEVPVIAPLKLQNNETLSSTDDGIFFSVFPKVRGRLLQEFQPTDLEQIGRLLGRLHQVGKKQKASHRPTLSYDWMCEESYQILKPKIPIQLQSHFSSLFNNLKSVITPILNRFYLEEKNHRIHGDCHLGNILWTQSQQHDRQAFFLDFDDMMTGPAVQDIWLIVRGRDEYAKNDRQKLIQSYESMCDFDFDSLALIETLRTLRMIHYSAWICKRWEDPIFQKAFPEFGSEKYWLELYADGNEQLGFLQTSDH